MNFHFGIDRLLADSDAVERLSSARVGLVAHPASVSGDHRHSIDALVGAGCNVLKAFGPQHGMRGDKQDNMIESEDFLDQVHGIPVVSLYGEHRRPTPDMLADLDIVLFDLQDVGCRIYTYITTLLYFIETCAELGKELWVLDRPNPAGRPVDGLFLEKGEESFVGCAPLPTRHGLTTGELAGWFRAYLSADLPLTVIPMAGYDPGDTGRGWPLNRPWINPSPNAASVNMTRCFPGTVLLEGTTLSEGRGTTVPLEVIGAPDLPVEDMLAWLEKEAPAWLQGAFIRRCYFSPTFHKHTGDLCTGLQFHTDIEEYDHEKFKPFRLIAGLLRALRQVEPGYGLWRDHEYEYELDRRPIDVINGGPVLRGWVDGRGAIEEMQALLEKAEADWISAREPHLIYG